MKSHLDQVAEFHAAFRYKQPEPQAPTLSCRETNELRPKLLREEMHELVAALTDNNRVEQLDALADLQYVLSGAVLAWGFRSMIEHAKRGCRSEFIHDRAAHLAAMLGLVAQMESYAHEGYPGYLMDALIKFQSRLDTCVVAFGFADVFEDAFAAVHANNLQKIWQESDIGEWNAVGQEELTFELTNCGFIARRSDGKIQKPIRHKKVELSRFI